MSAIVKRHIILILLFVFMFHFMSYANFEVAPVADRTPAVRDAIVKAIDGVDAAADVTAAQLASITVLNLRNKDISELKAGDFSGLTGLVNLNLYGNKLSGLPSGIFEGLTSLTTIRLGSNSVDPLPFDVSLEKVAAGQFKAVVPAGALFDIVLPITVANGSLPDSVATVTVLQGRVESDILTVTRTPETTDAVTVDIGTLPSLPSSNHYGYALVKSESLPLAVISRINTTPVFAEGTTVTRSVAENTDAGVNIGTPVAATDSENDVLTYTLSGTDASSFSIVGTSGQLQTKAALDYETQNAYTVTVSVSDGNGGADSITVTINVTDVRETLITPVSERTPQVRDAIVAAVRGVNNADDVTEAHLAAIRFLFLNNKSISSLKAGDFSGLTSLTSLNLINNSISDISALENLTSLTSLNLTNNSISDISALENLTSLTSLGLWGNSISDISALENLTSLTYLTLSGNSILDYTPLRRLKAAIEVAGRSLSLDITIPDVVSNTAPVFTDGTSTLRAVAENVSSNINIGAPITATDAEDDTLTWSLGGVDAAAFAIDSTTGQLQTKAALDYETQRVYSVTITVADEALSDTIVVIISVIDVSDTPISAGFVAVADRTPQVRDVIVAAVPNVAAAANVAESQVAAISSLNLRNKGITSLKTGDFSGMASLSSLNLYGNQLRRVPMGLFNGLTGLTSLRLGGNTLDPIPLLVSLQQVGIGEFRAVIPSGAPFDVVLPIRVTDGSLVGGITTVTISRGSVGSPPFTVVGTSAKVSLGTLPGLPRNHFGYTLAQTAIFNRTPEVTEVILKAVGVNDPSEVTDTDLAMLTRLDLDGMDITSLKADDFAGMLSLQTLTLSNNKLTTLPAGIFSDLTALTSLSLEGNNITTLPSNAFERLSFLLTLSLTDNDLTGLSGDSFAGIPNIRSLSLSNNKLTALPVGLFEGLTQLNQLQLNGNAVDPLPITVNLQKVGTNQVKAVVSTGTPFTVNFPITIANGTLAGGAKTLTIPTGEVESLPFTVTRTTGTIDAVTVDLEVLPKLPTSHNGYAFAKGIELPLEIIKPVNSPPIFTEGADTTRSVRENTAAGQNIGDAVKATDRDTADTLTYTLGGADAAAFAVDSKTGQLQTKAALDYETKNSYTLTLTVSDGKLTSVITVAIRVSDVNEAPIFTDGTSITRDIAENTDAGENIGAVITATDPDTDTLTYSLGGTDATAFRIDTATGQLKTSTALDYEIKPFYTLTIIASDGNLTDTIAVTINITDVVEEVTTQENVEGTPTNNAPVFSEGSTTTRTVLEDALAGVDIGDAVAATDADGHALTYTLGGIDAEAFSMDSTTGQLRTHAALDYETKSSYSVTITVSDGTESATIDVTINVTDATENSAPVFTAGTSTTRFIAENTGSGVDIGTAIAATDVNEDTLTYTLGGTDAAAFSINSATGQLRTEAALDYETDTSYTVTITVSDGKDGSDSITVTINVTDVDETSITGVDETLPNNVPIFSDGASTTRSVAEDTISGQDIGTAVSATDADDDTLTYSLGGTDASSFSINSGTGQLRTSAALDYETKTSYSVTVSVSDGNGGSDSITVTINVTDVQENRAPVFSDGDSTTRSIAENTGSGIDIGDAVSATDVDADTLTYSLGGTDASSFSINSGTGQLRTSAALDYETKTSYSVTVSVSDGNGGSDSITVTINVSDVDEAPANTAPAFDGDGTTRTVAENTDADANIGAAITATDTDDDTLIYTLGGTDAASFSIDSKTGQLKTKAALDYETKTSYTVTVIASDGTLTDSITVTINVTNVNEAPEFAEGANSTRTIAENVPEDINIGTAVAATDPEKSELTYTLGGTDAAAFSIDSKTGQLKTKAALDYETKTTYTVIVTVSDGSLTDTITVTIKVTNLDETPSNTPPVFDDGDSTTRSVAENTASNENIGTPIAATDADENTLAYLLSGTDASAFGIDSETGQLKTSAALNHETKDAYTVTVTVSDGSGTDTISVTIQVTDVNEAPSIAADTDTTRAVAENTAAGENIGSALTATDPDTGDTLTWTLGGTDAEAFSIDTATGQLKTKDALNYETKNQYEVTVSVSDGSLTDSIDMTINVTDIDENRAPVFSDGDSTTRSVAENTGSGQDIGSPVAATDADDDDLTYSLEGTNASDFSINTATGQLRTSAALDYETKTEYEVTVSVSDGTLTDTITVTINVTNVQENRAPEFSDGESTTRSVAEDTLSGEDIGSPVSATDADDDDLTYSLGGTNASDFSINTATGQLRTSAALDYETKTEYEVTVSVSDGTLTDTITVTINVTNVQENRAPEFSDGESTTRSIAENTLSGQDIGDAVSATDADEDTLTYSLGGTNASDFSINSTTGQLRTKSALDYENKTQYEVTVSVSDGNGGSDSITVTINVTDVQENRAPVFSDGESTTRAVAENTGSGQDIGDAVAATDADADTLTYSLGGTNASDFSINTATGQLRTSAALNYETKNQYEVTVSVSDGNGGSDSISVTINITDVNDAPTFTDGENTTRSVAENTAASQNIGSPVAATDDDGDTLTYSLSGTDATSFAIVGTSGQLQTNAALDYENKTQYEVTVSVSDGNGGSDSITVTINVTDVQENRAPVFSDGESTTRAVAENTGSGQDIGDAVAATDADADTLTYSLGGTNASDFSINTATGQLRTSAALNYETKNQYEVTVSVSDGNGGSDSISVTINITDVNDAPTFTDGENTTRSVAENTAASQNIGSPVAATDDDGDTLTYSLGGTDATSFAIVSTSGQLQTKAALDYETKDAYSVTVSVSDGEGGSDSITVTINITDVVETPTGTTPTITPVKDRTDFVKNAIVAAVPGVNRAEDVTAEHLTSITNLDLSGNDQVDDDFVGVVSLQSGDFDGLTGLRELIIYDNYINTFPEDVFDGLTSLRRLNLGYGDFDTLPAGLFDELTALRRLNLSDGLFDTLPLGIFDKLTSLEILNLNRGELDTLPAGLFDELTALRTLNMYELYIDTLPAGLFDELTALRTLDLGAGFFDTLPLGIFDELTALRTLDLSEGYYDTLPLGIFDELTSLQTLDLSDGFIESLPLGIFDKLTSLQTLDLRDNFLDIPAMRAAGFFDNIAASNIRTGGNTPEAPAAGIAVSSSTSLLQNYPNPFNPETWIPYQLSKPAKVTLTIYDMQGRVVRKLDLGLKPAGVYVSRSRAAYWDGRNNVGEKVAAGIYFYHLKAGDFTATRKMLIVK